MEKFPSMEVNVVEVSSLFKKLELEGIICRFNDFWPKLEILHQWVFCSWSTNCDIYLFSKGFILWPIWYTKRIGLATKWRALVLRQSWTINNSRVPRFCCNIYGGDFYARVRLPSLPLPFLHHQVLEDIGNKPGKF